MTIRNYDMNPELPRFKMNPDSVVGAGDHFINTQGVLLDTFICNDLAWAIVRLDEKDEPTLMKADWLLIEKKVYTPLNLIIENAQKRTEPNEINEGSAEPDKQ